jgi:Flp pilus assembly protein TadD
MATKTAFSRDANSGDKKLNRLMEMTQMTEVPELLAKVRTALLDGGMQSALTLSQEVLVLTPPDMDANYLHGLACFHSGDLARAVAVLSPVAAAVPNVAGLQTTLASACVKLGDLGAAEKH